jgi:deoxyribonuclease V
LWLAGEFVKRLRINHPWPQSTQEAIVIQNSLRALIVREDDLGPVRFVAGVDVGFEENGKVSRGALAVCAYPSLELVEHAIARMKTPFPYVPGLLAFREVPVLLEAFQRLQTTPDLLLCDGHGYAHPRRVGMACHLGLVCGLPTIGVAKRVLVGQHEPVGEEKGSWRPLHFEQETIGAILRTRCSVRPVVVSLGHRVSLATALHFVQHCTPRYRLPEPIRWAHRLASSKTGPP